MCKSIKEKEANSSKMQEIIHNLRIDNSKYYNLFKSIKASNLKDQRHLISNT